MMRKFLSVGAAVLMVTVSEICRELNVTKGLGTADKGKIKLKHYDAAATRNLTHARTPEVSVYQRDNFTASTTKQTLQALPSISSASSPSTSSHSGPKYLLGLFTIMNSDKAKEMRQLI